VRVVLCNCPQERADAIAVAVVEEGLAACVNIVTGVRSLYQWKGELVRDVEDTLILKVGVDGVERLRERLVQLHPYEVPEVVVLSVDAESSHRPYVDWVRAASHTQR
jgi:periplasmic divalent cation tolerance protein